MKHILLIDNYDSFTFNLLHSIEKNTAATVDVVRNDKLSTINVGKYHKILLSPGPGIPAEAGELMQFIDSNHKEKSILGICLGHQALGEYFGASLKNLSEPLHGIQLETNIVHHQGLYHNIPEKILTGHYHSWVLEEVHFPDCLHITAYNSRGGIMSFKHHKYDLTGIQYHPESVMTPFGDTILKNWLNIP